MIVAAAHFQLRPGMGGLKGPDHARQPVHRHAGEDPKPHGACVGAADFTDAFRQFLSLLHNGLHFRQQQLPGLRQLNAAPTAVHQAKAIFLLQIVQDVTDAGLGGAKRLGRFCQASQLHRADKCFIFFQTHGCRFLYMRKIHGILVILAYMWRNGNCFL